MHIQRLVGFSEAVFGEKINLKEKNIFINSHKKRFFYHSQGKMKLIVIPHFSGKYGLNSDESLQKAGEFISDLLRDQNNKQA